MKIEKIKHGTLYTSSNKTFYNVRKNTFGSPSLGKLTKEQSFYNSSYKCNLQQPKCCIATKMLAMATKQVLLSGCHGDVGTVFYSFLMALLAAAAAAFSLAWWACSTATASSTWRVATRHGLHTTRKYVISFMNFLTKHKRSHSN